MSQDIDTRVSQWQSWADQKGVPNPVSDGDPNLQVLQELTPTVRLMAYYNALLIEVDGAGVYTIADAGSAQKFR